MRLSSYLSLLRSATSTTTAATPHLWDFSALSKQTTALRTGSGALGLDRLLGTSRWAASSQSVKKDAARRMAAAVAGVQKLLDSNREWAEKVSVENPGFFEELAKGQAPEYLWIGCADSRVATNYITGTKPGEVFTHRNVGNIIIHTDMNCMSAIEYSVLHLKVKHVVVCGHYKCGAVQAALTMPQKSPGVTNCWISHIRDVRNEYLTELQELEGADRVQRLCEANAVRQAFHACTSPAILSAWDSGQEVYVHALIFDLATGRLKRLAGPIGSLEQAMEVKESYWVSNDGGESPTKAGVEKSLQEKITKDLCGVLSFESAI